MKLADEKCSEQVSNNDKTEYVTQSRWQAVQTVNTCRGNIGIQAVSTQ